MRIADIEAGEEPQIAAISTIRKDIIRIPSTQLFPKKNNNNPFGEFETRNREREERKPDNKIIFLFALISTNCQSLKNHETCNDKLFASPFL